MTINPVAFFFASIFIIAGIAVLIVGVVGIFRIKYVLNRLHAAAMIDSLGLFLIALGVMIIRGFSFDSAKLLMMVALFWMASPLCSHLLISLEVATNRDYEKEAKVVNLQELETEDEE